ncbi:hypothetical protein BC941DRAFT_500016 [Chlamydoabsidia padenii]|nr:hypothetical protein BC941DRAFT_500016 [Chlamydoabsidia padenii]
MKVKLILTLRLRCCGSDIKGALPLVMMFFDSLLLWLLVGGFTVLWQGTTIPIITKDKATEAQQWIAIYEFMAEFIGFDPVEKVDELQDVSKVKLRIGILDYNPIIQKDWVVLKGKFLP